MSKKDLGLIGGYLLDGKGSGRSLHWEDIHQWHAGQSGLLWVHLDYTSRTAKQWLHKKSGIDPVIVQALLAEDARPRILSTDQGMLIILRGLNFNPGAEPEDMVSVRIWLEKNRIITTRKRPLLSINDLRENIANHLGPKTPGEFLACAAECIITRMNDVLEDREDQCDALEDEVLNLESRLLRPKIAGLRREVIAIRRYLAPQREALLTLQNKETPLLAELDKAHLRETTDTLIRYIEDLDSIRDRAAVTQEELSSRLQEQLDKRMYALSIVAVIFLPLTFITGLLGINVGGIPGGQHPWAFIAVCIILIGLAIIEILLFKRWRWLN